MGYVQLSEGVSRWFTPLLVVPVLRSCQSPIWIWPVNYLHLQLHLHSISSIHMIWTMLSNQLFRALHLPCVGAMPHICTQSLRGANSQWRYSACIFSLQTHRHHLHSSLRTVSTRAREMQSLPCCSCCGVHGPGTLAASSAIEAMLS